MMENTYEFVDRYSATGRPYPNPETVCLGYCEGMGCVPVNKPRSSDSCREIDGLYKQPEWRKRWEESHAKHCNPFGVIRELIKNRQGWYWKSIARDIGSLLKGKGYCDGWHFVECPDCKGTGVR